GSKHGVDRERETDLGGDAVDVGEAHADEAAEALDLRRHVRRRHPRLHHLPARLSPPPPPPPRERECRPLQSKGELRGFFPPLCAAAAAWSPSRWCSWARSGGPSPFNPNVKGKKYTQGPSTCYRRYKIVPPIRPSTDKTVRFRSLDGFDPGFVRHGGRVSVRPTWPPHVRLAHHLPPSVPLSLFSSLTRCRAIGGREEDPRRDGEVGGGGGGDENGRGREGSESRAAGETASAAKEATRETKEGYDEEAYSCGGGRRRTSSRTRRGKVGEEGGGGPHTRNHPARAADANDDDELLRLLSLAETDLDASHLRAVHKHAHRAARLDPDSPRGSLLLTAVSVLVADHSSHRATLLLPDSDS
ncbi:Os12g0564750, partial [Oryza sativa Japonica Group]